MEELESINPGLPEVDIIYQVLKSSAETQGKSLKELLQTVFKLKGWSLDDHKKMAAIHTQLIFDNRFINLGQGLWGLKEWKQAKVVRRNLSYGSRSIPYHRHSLREVFEIEEKESTDKFANDDGDNRWDDD